MRHASLVLALLCGCDPTAPIVAEGTAAVTAVASCRADNVVVADVQVTVSGVSSARVVNDYGEASPALAIEADGVYQIPMLGMTPGNTNHLRVEVITSEGTSAGSGDLTVDCDALPAELPGFASITGSAPEGGYLLIAAVSSTTKAAMAAVVDHSGRVYWYRRLKQVGDFKRAPNGDFVYYQDSAFAEENLYGSIIRTWTDPLASRGADNHEVVLLPQNHALIYGLNQRSAADTTVTENTLAELDGDGEPVFHWSGLDHIGLEETTSDIDFAKPPVDVEHANAIELLSDGNLLLSLRHTDTLYKVDRRSGDVLWRLGGAKSNFTFAGDALSGFSHQHFARQLGGGDILLLDNGNLHDPQTSRVVQYRLDEDSHTATLVWEHRHRAGLYTSCCGSSVRLESGNTLTAWGTTGVIEEVDPSENLIWEMTVPDSIVYRAQPMATLYPE